MKPKRHLTPNELEPRGEAAVEYQDSDFPRQYRDAGLEDDFMQEDGDDELEAEDY